MKKIHVKVCFTEELLGTMSNNAQLYTDFIGSKAPDATTLEDEVAALGEDTVAARGMTVFPRLPDGTPFLYDYQWKGFFKDTCGILSRLTKKDPETGKKLKGGAVNESGKLTAFKKVIDGLIFPQPRKIPIQVGPEGIGLCERPLRAATAQGERISLSASETVPAGSTCEFDILCVDDSLVQVVLEWMDYGALRGTGQWRNSGKGRFTYEVVSIE